MANTRELRRRIKSVKNTSQITKAMQMVAAAKMRRAQDQATAGRPYAENLSQALGRLLPKVEAGAHPLLGGNKANGNDRTEKIGVILLSTDKGLVGALNTNLIRLVASMANNMVFYTVGRKGRSYVVRAGKDLKADFENVDVITFRQAKQLAKLITDSYQAGEIGEVYLIYPKFLSTLRQEPNRVKLLPIAVADLSGAKLDHPEGGIAGEFLFEPDPDTLLDYLLVHHLQEQIYQSLLETKASEHSSRMIAMKNATDNALELVDDLRLTYNQTRQASITTELLEITTAQIALQ